MCEACDGPGMALAHAAAVKAGSSRKTRYRIAGMDCASCARKIDTAVRRILRRIAPLALNGNLTCGSALFLLTCGINRGDAARCAGDM